MKQQLEQIFSNRLQRNLQLQSNNKTIKQGKLINYTVNDYVVTLMLKNNKNQLKSYDLYHPYDIHVHDDQSVRLDYRVSTLTTGQSALQEQIYTFLETTVKNHKLYDSQVDIIIA
jgi:hypothetical protein